MFQLRSLIEETPVKKKTYSPRSYAEDVARRLGIITPESGRADAANPSFSNLIYAMVEAENDNQPKITGIVSNKKKESLADAQSNAAVTFAQAFKPSDITVLGVSSSLVVHQKTPPKPLQSTRESVVILVVEYHLGV